MIHCSTDENPIEQVSQQLAVDFATLDQLTDKKLLPLARTGDERTLQEAFKEVRIAYKKVEWFTEHYAPTTSRYLNGPPLPEIEVEETKKFEPGGLQVIEEDLYPFDSQNRKKLIRDVEFLLSKIRHAQSIAESTQLTEANLLNASKLEVFRIIALGLSGFDTPLSNNLVPEAITALQTIEFNLAKVADNPEISKIVKDASDYLAKTRNVNDLDRMEFIIRFASPLSREIVRRQQELKIEPLKTELALYNRTETLFDKDIFNPDFFSKNIEASYTNKKVALGKALFSDPIVAGANRTCQSCHKPELAFTDGLTKSQAIIPGTFVKRNAPTLYYAGLQNAQFYDMRSPSLENQAMDVLANKDEMHASVEEAAIRLSKHAVYYQKFKEAFPTMEQELKPRFVMMAIASYIRSLSPFSSRFDLHIRGEKQVMNREEIKGFNLFMGKGKCGTCHFMPLFNGTAPPAFTTTEAEVLGVPGAPDKQTIDPDSGRYHHNKIDELKFSFKTPTLRNIAKTAPYMHNGAFKTLEQVMTFYNNGGGSGIGIRLEHQTLSADKLDLSEPEQKAIIAFLNCLTDEELKK